jgi:hypothetical protein
MVKMAASKCFDQCVSARAAQAEGMRMNIAKTAPCASQPDAPCVVLPLLRSFGTCQVYDNRLELLGAGSLASATYAFQPTTAAEGNGARGPVSSNAAAL